MREPLLIKPLPMSECEANKAAPFQGTSTPSQPVCLFIARMEIINASPPILGHMCWEVHFPLFCRTGLGGRGTPVTPHLSFGRDQHPRLPNPPNKVPWPKPDSRGCGPGKG